MRKVFKKSTVLTKLPITNWAPGKVLDTKTFFFNAPSILNDLEAILGIVSGCNTSVTITQPFTYEAYPGMQAPASWFFRNPPTIEFNECNLQNLCTVVFYDAGHGVLHSYWFNWPKITVA